MINFLGHQIFDLTTLVSDMENLTLPYLS